MKQPTFQPAIGRTPGPAGRPEHAALAAGLKHCLCPFDAYAQGSVPHTPCREEQDRQTVDNFYYDIACMMRASNGPQSQARCACWVPR